MGGENKILIAIIIPGLLLAFLYSTYIIIRCYLQPSVAPIYDVPSVPAKEKIMSVGKYVLPLIGILFLVTGVIFLGIATPTEAAATGAFGSFILVAFYRRLGWKLVKESVSQTILISGMMKPKQEANIKTKNG